MGDVGRFVRLFPNSPSSLKNPDALIQLRPLGYMALSNGGRCLFHKFTPAGQVHHTQVILGDVHKKLR